MKHNIKITLILISMFFITQLIGLAVIKVYTPVTSQVIINGTAQNVTDYKLPYGMEPPQASSSVELTFSIILSFIFAVLIIFVLMNIKAKAIIRTWFFAVVVIVLGISINAFFLYFNIFQSEVNLPIFGQMPFSWLASIIIALPFATYKIFKQNILIHNLTELFIYPGIAVVLIPLLNIWSVIVILILISVYDLWAVWHSGFMQKMAKYQIDHIKVFSGFFVPYLNKKQRDLVKQARLDMQNNKLKSKFKKKMKKIKVNLAILGGGDVVFPIITSGVIFRTLGFIPALIVIFCSTIALSLLFVFAKKGKFYPAMPFITAGLFTGIGLSYLLF